ncbi:MAG TPA: dihydroorotase family protein [Candidatus Dormibacteraeota bacterium]|nr:dihydroorotase family protein [Candidatus Dormibacteraeota bacterium]
MTERVAAGDLVIAGGTVYTPEGPREVDVQVSGGVITSLDDHRPNRSAPLAAPRVLDARGMYVLPGAIDVHVHSRDPGFPEKEDFGTLTAAAAAGGVTTVIDMPNTVPAADAAGLLEAKAALARRKARVDFGLWGLIRSSSTAEQLAGLAAAGTIGFKAYLGYAFSRSRKQVLPSLDPGDADLEAPPDYGTLLRLAPAIARLGLPLVIHAEDPGILAAFRRPFDSYDGLLASRPPEAEAVAISAAAAIATSTGVHVHVAHLSSAAGLRAAETAIRAGSPLTLETCPQYLLLCDEDFPRLGAAMKMFPPVRTAGDRAALVDGLARGVIALVATDHAPHTDGEKAKPLEEAAAGSPGVQTLYLSCLELAKRLGDVWKAPRWVCEAPAALVGLRESKGSISPGFDADIVVVDPNRATVVRPALMRSRQRHGAMDGLECGFSIREVYVRGELVESAGAKRGRASGRMVRPARAGKLTNPLN